MYDFFLTWFCKQSKKVSLKRKIGIFLGDGLWTDSIQMKSHEVNLCGMLFAPFRAICVICCIIQSFHSVALLLSVSVEKNVG